MNFISKNRFEELCNLIEERSNLRCNLEDKRVFKVDDEKYIGEEDYLNLFLNNEEQIVFEIFYLLNKIDADDYEKLSEVLAEEYSEAIYFTSI